MDTKNPDKLPAKGIFRVKVKYTIFSIHQMNEDRGLKPSDSERQIYFNGGCFSEQMYEPNILPSK